MITFIAPRAFGVLARWFCSHKAGMHELGVVPVRIRSEHSAFGLRVMVGACLTCRVWDHHPTGVGLKALSRRKDRKVGGVGTSVLAFEPDLDSHTDSNRIVLAIDDVGN
jgi:hypothetical protein